MIGIDFCDVALAISREECAHEALLNEFTDLDKCNEKVTHLKGTEEYKNKTRALCETQTVTKSLAQINSCTEAPNDVNHLDKEIQPKVLKCTQCAPLVKNKNPLNCVGGIGTTTHLNCMKDKLKAIGTCIYDCIK